MAETETAISTGQIAAQLADENPSPMLRVAADGTLLFANRACRELLGSWRCHPGRPVPDHVRRHVQSALQSGRRLEWEEMLGEQSLLFVVVPFASGGYAGIFGRDIQKRRQVETQLRIVAEQLRSFFELSPDLMAVAGFDGRFKQLSPSWHRTLGHTIDELTSHPWLHFVHPDDHEKTMAAAERVVAGETLSLFVNRYRCKDGSYRWIEWHCTTALEQQLIYCVARDVTERKQTDEAFQKANLERTRELETVNSRLKVEIA
jgi:PAS domain S-box-containing protein